MAEAETDMRIGENKKRTACALGWFSLFGFLLFYFSLFRDALIDDAFITFQYSRNLANHGHWGMIEGAISNTATSPLNTIITALAFLILRPGVHAALVLAAVEAWLICFLLNRISMRLFANRFFFVISAAAILGNPLLISTLGLESLLFALLIVVSVHAMIADRPVALGAAIGLLSLARPDGCILLPVCLVFLKGWRSKALVLTACAAVVIPWLLYSWIHLGSLAPDTLFIKRSQESWEHWTFANGVRMYFIVFPVATALSLLPGIGVFFLSVSRNRQVWLVARVVFLFGVLHYLAYALLGVPPYHWYYAPEAACICLLGALGIASLRASRRVGKSRFTQGAFYGIVPVLAAGIVCHFAARGEWFIKESPIQTNWAAHNDYQAMGLWMKENLPEECQIELQGEIGTLIFYSERALIDEFSDRARVAPMIVCRRALGGPKGFLYRQNFRHLESDLEAKPVTHFLIAAPSVTVVPGASLLKEWQITSARFPKGCQWRLWEPKNE